MTLQSNNTTITTEELPKELLKYCPIEELFDLKVESIVNNIRNCKIEKVNDDYIIKGTREKVEHYTPANSKLVHFRLTKKQLEILGLSFKKSIQKICVLAVADDLVEETNPEPMTDIKLYWEALEKIEELEARIMEYKHKLDSIDEIINR